MDRVTAACPRVCCVYCDALLLTSLREAHLLVFIVWHVKPCTYFPSAVAGPSCLVPNVTVRANRIPSLLCIFISVWKVLELNTFACIELCPRYGAEPLPALRAPTSAVLLCQALPKHVNLSVFICDVL